MTNNPFLTDRLAEVRVAELRAEAQRLSHVRSARFGTMRRRRARGAPAPVVALPIAAERTGARLTPVA